MAMALASARCLRILEFYSGIGGLRYALEEAKVDAIILEAFEINDAANDVYEHNFGHRPNQGNIQRLTVKDLEKYHADAWLLSPPCQPYTRQGLQKDSADARASSFLELLDMLPRMSMPPAHIFIENVVGFETSLTRTQFMKVLEGAGFRTQEFILSPLQFAIPYSRPRYFCLAKREPLKFGCLHLNGHLLCRPMDGFMEPGYCFKSEPKDGHTHETRIKNEPELDPTLVCRPIRDYLEVDLPCENTSAAESTMQNPLLQEYMVPSEVVERWGDAFDIVTPESTRCCCFTKSYGRYAKGTGSILVTNSSGYDMFFREQTDLRNSSNKSSLEAMGLRYFTPREVANFHSFPQEFSFPSHIATKQRYALLGNSLNVKVVAYLLQYLFSTS